MWPGLIRCRECRCRYSLHPVCPLCRERAEWDRAARVGWQFWAMILAALLYAVLIGLGVPYLLAR